MGSLIEELKRREAAARAEADRPPHSERGAPNEFWHGTGVPGRRCSAEIGDEPGNGFREVLRGFHVRDVPDARQDLYFAAPERRHGESAQVIQADQLIAFAVQHRDGPWPGPCLRATSSRSSPWAAPAGMCGRSSSTPAAGSGSWARLLIPLRAGSPGLRGTSSWISRTPGAGGPGLSS